MAPFLGYSGRGRIHQGERGTGPGPGPGRGRGGKTFRTTNKHRWIRSITGETNIDDNEDNGQPKTTSINIENDSSIDTSTNTIGIKVTRRSHSNNNTEDLIASKYVIMKKNGHNKLILSSRTRSVAVVAAAAASTSIAMVSTESKPKKYQTLTRDGDHKLISTSNKNKNKLTNARVRKQPINHLNNVRSRFRQQTSSGSVNNTKVQSYTTSRPAAKRVKLPPKNIDTVRNEKNNDLCVTYKTQNLDSDKELKSQLYEKDNVPKGVEKLTDFAYRETSRVRQQAAITSHNLQWPKKNESPNTFAASTGSSKRKIGQPTINKHKNMGLVRIQPNEEKTPICPTFLRGIQCHNQYCRKRHDVPKEYAVPICSFFQRHGQCLRGESCVFRHIRNSICPFCQKRHDPSKEFCSYFMKV